MERPVRTMARLVALGLMVVLATACLRAHQDLTLNEDDTVDGTIIFAVNRDLLELSGQSIEDFMDEMGPDTGLPEGIDAEVSPYEDGDLVGSEFTFEGAPLEVWNDAGEDNRLAITRQGDTFVVRGTFDASGGEFAAPELPGAEDLLQDLDVRISVTFPGEVESHNGELDGRTVSWQLGIGQVNEIEAVGSAIDSGGGGGAILVWILLAVAVVAGAVLVVLLISARRRESAPAAAMSVAATETPETTLGEPDAAAAASVAAPASEPPPTPAIEPPPAPVPVEPPDVPSTQPLSEPPESTGGPADADGASAPPEGS